MSNIWFTSDWHIHHKNIVRGVSDWPKQTYNKVFQATGNHIQAESAKLQTELVNCRDFDTLEEHDIFIIDKVNKKVRSSDVLYNLGDVGLGFKWKDRFKELRRKINCETIYLAKGNHDHIFDDHRNSEIISLFKDVRDIYYKKIGGRFFVLCHYAMRTWPWQHHKSIQLYGHSHGNLPDNPDSLSLDVGVDTCLFGHEKFTPYSIDEIFHIMDNYKKFVSVDHHKEI